MANNCKLTQLKGSVNNDNLEFYNAVRINLKSTQQIAYLNFGVSRDLKLFGSATFTNSSGSEDNGKEQSGSSSCYIKGITDGDYLVINGRYDLDRISSTDNINFIENKFKLNLDYCADIVRLTIGNGNQVNIDLNRFSLYNKKITYFRLFYGNNQVYGDLETIAENMLAIGRDGSVVGDKFCIGTDSTNFKLNGVKTVNDYNTINFISSSSIIIYAGENKTSGTVVASYDGTSWTYGS